MKSVASIAPIHGSPIEAAHWAKLRRFDAILPWPCTAPSERLAHHEIVFPSLRDTGLTVGLGPLGLQYILKVGGSGYFRTRAVQPHLDSGKLHRIANAPEFSFSIYALSSTQSDSEATRTAREGLRVALNTEQYE